MNQPESNIYTGFKITPWEPFAGPSTDSIPQSNAPPDSQKSMGTPASLNGQKMSIIDMIGADARRLLWDIVCYLYSSTNVRIKRLGISGRSYENAKHELIEKGLVIESTVGLTKNLIPLPLVFGLFETPCPYPDLQKLEHSFRICHCAFLLENDPGIKSVYTEYKIGKQGHTADVATIRFDGTLDVHEVTLSTGNIIQNCLKYEGVAVAHINFLCRNTDMVGAVNSVVKGAPEIPPTIFNRLEVLAFSALLKRSRKYFSM